MYLAPPGANKDALAALRKAFMPALTSAAYHAEATKILSYAPAPADHNRAVQVLRAPSKISKIVVKYFSDYVKAHSKK